MAKKDEKKTTKPEFNFLLGADIRTKLERQLDEHIADVYGLEGFLYDMWADYRKSKQILETTSFSVAEDTELGSFGVRLFAAKSHKGTREHSGAAVFKYCLEYKNEGEHETRVDTAVLSGKSTTDILYSLTSYLGREIQDWYEDKYEAKYGEVETNAPF